MARNDTVSPLWHLQLSHSTANETQKDTLDFLKFDQSFDKTTQARRQIFYIQSRYLLRLHCAIVQEGIGMLPSACWKALAQKISYGIF